MSKSTRPALLLLLLLSSALSVGAPACKKRSPTGASGSKVMRPREVPAALQPAVAAADKAFAQLARRLKKRLMAAMKDGGPVAAIKVCSEVAQPLTKKSRGGTIIAIGRTSHKLRDPKNAPPSWAAPFVAKAKRGDADAGKPAVVDLGDRIGVLRPISVKPLCLACHGAEQALDDALRDALKKAYPDDQALGFQARQLRGYFWAEVKKPSAQRAK